MPNKTQQFVQKLIAELTTSGLQKYRDSANRIRKKHDPRQLFASWRDSTEGKTWKHQEYLRIGGKCPGCGLEFPDVTYFTIDHIQPISIRPDLTLEISNLGLLCFRCNIQKGSSHKSMAKP